MAGLVIIVIAWAVCSLLGIHCFFYTSATANPHLPEESFCLLTNPTPSFETVRLSGFLPTDDRPGVGVREYEIFTQPPDQVMHSFEPSSFCTHFDQGTQTDDSLIPGYYFDQSTQTDDSDYLIPGTHFDQSTQTDDSVIPSHLAALEEVVDLDPEPLSDQDMILVSSETSRGYHHPQDDDRGVYRVMSRLGPNAGQQMAVLGRHLVGGLLPFGEFGYNIIIHSRSPITGTVTLSVSSTQGINVTTQPADRTTTFPIYPPPSSIPPQGT
jgi:hypothetical protein